MKKLILSFLFGFFLVVFSLSAFGQQAPEENEKNDSGTNRAAKVVLRNGSVIHGKIKKRSHFDIKTNFGTVHCPISSIRTAEMTRFAPSGPKSQEQIVSSLIEQLSATALDKRTYATNRLRELGGVTVSFLKEHRDDENPEVRTRVRKLLTHFQENGIDSRTPRDHIRGNTFDLTGWITAGTLRFQTPHGELDIDLRNLEKIILTANRSVESPGRKIWGILLTNGDAVAGTFPENSFSVDTGYGTLDVPASEVQTVNRIDGRFRINTSKGILSGTIKADTLRVRTGFQKLNIPVSSIASISRNWHASMHKTIKIDFEGDQPMRNWITSGKKNSIDKRGKKKKVIGKFVRPGTLKKPSMFSFGLNSRKRYARSGRHSIGGRMTRSRRKILARRSFERPIRLRRFEFSYYELHSSNGGGIRLKNERGRTLFGFATDNPQWEIRKGEENWKRIHDGKGYRRWVNVRVTFFPAERNAKYRIMDLKSGTTRTGTVSLPDTPITLKSIEIGNYSDDGWDGNSKFQMWMDDIIVNGSDDK